MYTMVILIKQDKESNEETRNTEDGELRTRITAPGVTQNR